MRILRVFLTAISVFLFCASSVAQDLPKTTADGLELVTPTEVDAFYWLDGARAGDYQKVKLLDCYIAFEENWKRDYNRKALQSSDRVDDRDMEQMKSRLAATFRQNVERHLNQAGYDIVEGTGADVLLVRPAILNLDIESPDLDNTSQTLSLSSTAGSMTLLMELYDSATSTKIGMVMDAASSRDVSTAPVDARTRNQIESNAMINMWSTFLVQILDGSQPTSH